MPTNSMEVTLLLFAVTGFFLLLTVLLRAFVRSRRGIPLRPLTGYSAVPRQQGRSIETGQGLHISLGTSGVGGADTASTLAGLAVLETLTDEAVASDSPPTVTVSDPTTLILAQDALRRAYVRQHNASAYDPRSVRFVAAAPIPYAAAVMDILAHEEMAVNIMIGAFGAEAALIVEEGARQNATQIVGTSDVGTLPLVYPSSDHLLVGEEMYVSGAYVGPNTAYLSSLMTQDIFRWIIVAAILVGAFLLPFLG
jgi:Domain of unknown function (DUF6754)